MSRGLGKGDLNLVIELSLVFEMINIYVEYPNPKVVETLRSAFSS